MFPQNRVGKPFLPATTLALFVVLSAAWVRSIPSSEPEFPPVREAESARPHVSDAIAAPQPAKTVRIHPLPPRIAQSETSVLSGFETLIPKAEAAAETPGLPVRLSIAGTNIDFPVIDLGLLPGGKLDAPKDGKTLGWYRLGPKPGQTGNSVIDGHLTTAEGPGAFWNLKRVKVGDIVSVTDNQSVTRRFKVRMTQVYHVNRAPMNDIFGASDGKHLNLITCAGVWDTTMDHYNKRLVVYTDLVE